MENNDASNFFGPGDPGWISSYGVVLANAAAPGAVNGAAFAFLTGIVDIQAPPLFTELGCSGVPTWWWVSAVVVAS